MPDLPAEVRESGELCVQALAAATAQPADVDRVMAALDRLAAMGADAMFGAMCGWAQALFGGATPVGMWVPFARGPDGQDEDLDGLVRDADGWGLVASVRFFAACGNGDMDAAASVVNAAPDVDAAWALIMQVLSGAAVACRRRIGAGGVW